MVHLIVRLISIPLSSTLVVHKNIRVTACSLDLPTLIDAVNI